MIRIPFRRNPTGDATKLLSLLEDAKAGDRLARDALLRQFQPFVLRVAKDACGRKIGESDEEFQMALLALNEAIDAYRSDRGSFVAFSETVMKRRLIDYFRARSKQREIPFAAFDEVDDEGDVYNSVENDTALMQHAVDEETRNRAEEIARYTVELQRFGIDMNELVDICPKHDDARRNAVHAARMVAKTEALRAMFLASGTLPLKQLEPLVDVSRKTLERQRRYIIAVAVLLLGDYEMLQSFVGEELR
ncbi:RNA polymerase sigma-I factor [Ferroacidibacillus organovorans]|uniref:RNA polymerase sigma-I factor n=1 Tax=Ferroacidibacillus organovorans TaxID=1765683 RepID=UPI00191078F0|nr:RNA polymerase sigma-I factor [Ferroacidibacillus organovorans]